MTPNKIYFMGVPVNNLFLKRNTTRIETVHISLIKQTEIKKIRSVTHSVYLGDESKVT